MPSVVGCDVGNYTEKNWNHNFEVALGAIRELVSDVESFDGSVRLLHPASMGYRDALRPRYAAEPACVQPAMDDNSCALDIKAQDVLVTHAHVQPVADKS